MSSRDLPKSVGDFLGGWVAKSQREFAYSNKQRTFPTSALSPLPSRASLADVEIDEDEVEAPTKLTAKGVWTCAVAGTGLFSDGYVNNSIGTVSTCLSTIYGKQYTDSHAISNVSSIAFAGTVFGQLLFGYVADFHSRKIAMIISTAILILFTVLCAGAWGAHGTPGALFTAITAYRFLLGIGIGGEYPAGSTACAEAATALPKGLRNRFFIMFTNFMIDFGFVVSAFVPLVMLWIAKDNHLNTVWRVTIGLGAIPPIGLFFMRMKFQESEGFKKHAFKKITQVPYGSVIKFYWFRMIVVALIWFIYDFSAYSFGIYSSYMINQIIPDGDIYKTFGWNVVFNLFYLPGSLLGALSSDYFGPRLTLFVGLIAQGVFGFAMAGAYPTLKHHVGGFVVVYGVFTSFGEFGPGDNVGMLAAKTSATPIRGQYYGICAAVGKIGAFVGTYVFPIIIRKAGGPDTDSGNQAPFYVSSALCLFSAFLGLLCLPRVDQDAVEAEDKAFISYLRSTGYDISQLGHGYDDVEENAEKVFVNDSAEK